MIRVSTGKTSEQPLPPWLLDESAVDAALSRPQRCRALERSGLLSTDFEQTFDALTRLAGVLLEAPVAFVGVPTPTQDLYKSLHGAPEPLASQRVITGRTICHYTLAAGTPLVIDDTHAQAPWNQVPTVETLGVRAYIGVPIVLDGEVVASLCVVDTQPRQWRDRDIEALVQLGLSAQRELTLRAALALASDRLHAHERAVARTAHALRGQAQALQLCAIQLRRGSQDAQSRAIARLDRTVDDIRQQLQELHQDTLDDSGDALAPSTADDLLREAIKVMQPLAARRGIELTCTIDAQTQRRVTQRRLLRALNTLLGETIRALPPGVQLKGELLQVAGQLHFVAASTPTNVRVTMLGLDDHENHSDSDNGHDSDHDDAADAGDDGAALPPASWTLAETLLNRLGGQLHVSGDAATGLVVSAVLDSTDA